jgi:hypothetical protein
MNFLFFAFFAIIPKTYFNKNTKTYLYSSILIFFFSNGIIIMHTHQKKILKRYCFNETEKKLNHRTTIQL